MEQINSGTTVNEKDIVEDVFGKFSGAENYFNQVNEKEFSQLAVAHAKMGFKYLSEQRQFRGLPLLEQIRRRVDAFKDRLIVQGSVFAGFNVAYGSGGRSMFRDAVNAFLNFVSTNFKTMKYLFSNMIIDVIRGKRLAEVMVDFNVFIRDTVRELQKDPENLNILRHNIKELYATAKGLGELFEGDVLEFPGTVSLYDGKGKLRSSKDIDAEFNTNRCNHVRGLIKKLLAANRQEYDEAATEFLRTELPMASVFDELEKKFKRPLPDSIPTEESLKDKLNRDDFPTLCELYDSLKSDAHIAA